MRFNDNSKLAGKHALLSASQGSWLNYSDDKIDRVFNSQRAAQRGTDLHDLAMRLIRLRERLPELQRTLNMYVNDAIGFRMTTELTLFYSVNAFGTCDAIYFRKNKETDKFKLAIFDLKTGLSHSSIRQLMIYAAYFCLEYGFNPLELEIELRIYQNDDVEIWEADPIEIRGIMDRIVYVDRRINQLREEAE